MPQIFHRSTNTIARLSIAAVAGSLALFAAVGGGLVDSTYLTNVRVPQEQPLRRIKHLADATLMDSRRCPIRCTARWAGGRFRLSGC